MGNASLLTSDSSLWLRPSRITPLLPESQLSFWPPSLAGLKNGSSLFCSYWVPSLDNKILKPLPVIMNELKLIPCEDLSLFAMPAAGGSSPDLSCPQYFQHRISDCPFALKPHGFLFSSWMVLICKGREVLLHFLSGGQRRDHTAHIINALGRRLPSHSDLQLFDILEVDNELTKPVLKHLLCKAGTCCLASHFEIW